MTLSQGLMFKVVGLTEAEANNILSFAGLDGNATFNDTNRCLFYKTLLLHLSQENKGVISESEGGYSKTYDKVGKSNYLYALANESGCPELIDMYNPNPKIRDKSNYW